MSGAWMGDELKPIGATEEVEVAARGKSAVTIWAVREGDDIYVRSAVKGRDAAWYRAVRRTHEGTLTAGRLVKKVTFVDAEPAVNDRVDAAYRSKYRRYAGRILNSCLTPEARSTTLKIVPR